MTDANTVALRRHEAQQDACQRHRDAADLDRARLIDDWIDEASMADVLDVLNEIGLMEVNAIKRMIVATAKGRSLGVEKNQEALMIAAALFCQLLRTQVDNMHGESLVEKYAEALAEYRPCRCGEVCTC